MGTLGWGLIERQQSSLHTTPDAIGVHARLAAMRDAGATSVAMEVSSHAIDQGRVNAVRFDTAILTNLSRDHLDYHGDMAAYGAVKGRLFAFSGLKRAILNQDDELGRQLLATPAKTVETTSYGITQGQFRARDIVQTDTGLRFDLHWPDGEIGVRARLFGRFNVENLLAVIACLSSQGYSVPEVVKVVARLQPVPGRMNLLGGGDRPVVVVDYAHTPDALKQALEAVRAHCSGRVHCVFGCGGERDTGKRRLMAAVAEQLADVVIVTDDNPRAESGDQIVAGIMSGFEQAPAVQVIRDRATAISTAIHQADTGDVVLLAGKGHEDYQEVDGQRHHFDDRQVAARALEVCP